MNCAIFNLQNDFKRKFVTEEEENMVIIYDKEGREYFADGIEGFEIGSNEVFVYKDKTDYSRKVNHIAKISFDCPANSENEIGQINPYLANVLPEYQRRGIATNVIKEIKQLCYAEIVFVNALNEPVEDKNEVHYSDAGMALMESLCRQEIARKDYYNDYDD